MMIRGGGMDSAQSADKPGHRLSVSLTAEQHEHLLDLARRNRVSVAWVVREAIERLLKDDAPLFRFEPRQ